jgi:hypothetical protein
MDKVQNNEMYIIYFLFYHYFISSPNNQATVPWLNSCGVKIFHGLMTHYSHISEQRV